MVALPDLRMHVREEPVPPETPLIRGGPDSAAKLEKHARRLERAYVLDGASILGISMFAALDDVGPASLDDVLGGRLSTYRLVHVVSARSINKAGLAVLPTFGRPHVTVILDSLHAVNDLLNLLGPPESNHRYGETRQRRGDRR